MKKSTEIFNTDILAAQKELQDALYNGVEVTVVNAKRETLKSAVERCNEEIRSENDLEFLAAENPFLTAITTEFIDIYKFVEKEDKKTGKITVEVGMKKELIDLQRLESLALDRRLAANCQWIYWVEKFAYVVGARCTKEVGGNHAKYAEAFKISQTANGLDIGATPTSNNQMLKQLQTIIDGILFIDNGSGLNELKALTVDVQRIVLTCCKDSKDSNNIVTPRANTMTRLIVKAMNRIITGGTYEAE